MATKRILVVDDDLSILEVVEAALRWLGGWQVLKAHSGKTGLEKAHLEKPDMILLDVTMPDLDGLTFLDYLRSDSITQSIPVILLTGYRYLPHADILKEKGVLEVIPKPFAPVNLVKRVAEEMKC